MQQSYKSFGNFITCGKYTFFHSLVKKARMARVFMEGAWPPVRFELSAERMISARRLPFINRDNITTFSNFNEIKCDL